MEEPKIKTCMDTANECVNKRLLDDMQGELHLLQIILFGSEDCEGIKERLKGLEIMTDTTSNSIQEVKGSLKTIGVVAERLVRVETNLNTLSRAMWTFVGILGAVVSAALGRYIYDLICMTPAATAQVPDIVGRIFSK